MSRLDFAYGPHIEGEADLRLLGDVEGKRVLILGCRHAEPVAAIAAAGARAIALDHLDARVDRARDECERAGVRADFHRGDLAELAFLRGDSIDAVVSVYAAAEVEDLNRLFRQVHRVMSPGAALVLSLPHPAYAILDPAPAPSPAGGGDEGAAPPVVAPPGVTRSYFDASPRPGRRNESPDHPHPLSGVFTSLTRAKFAVDTLLEPEPDPGPPGTAPPPTWQPAMRWLPPTLVLRARKLGV